MQYANLKEQIPCVFHKPSINGHFTDIFGGSVKKFGTLIASTITRRYYKGIGGSGDNMVLCVFEVDDSISDKELEKHGLYKGCGHLEIKN